MVPTANPSHDPTAAKPPRAKRWIPISLRMFLVMLAVVGVAGVLGVGLPAYRQHVAIRDIEQVDGSMRSDPVGPAWLRSWVGDERMKLFDHVVHVEFGL